MEHHQRHYWVCLHRDLYLPIRYFRLRSAQTFCRRTRYPTTLLFGHFLKTTGDGGCVQTRKFLWSRSKYFLLLTGLALFAFTFFIVLKHQSPATIQWVRDLVPFCPLAHYTGLKCPGCGGTRAYFACLQGDYLQAIRYNIFWIPAAGVLLIEYIHSFLYMIRGNTQPRWWQLVRARTYYGFGMLTVTYMIVRNIWDF